MFYQEPTTQAINIARLVLSNKIPDPLDGRFPGPSMYFNSTSVVNERMPSYIREQYASRLIDVGGNTFSDIYDPFKYIKW